MPIVAETRLLANWWVHGTCRKLHTGTADKLFFPAARNEAAHDRAKAICADCPVRLLCLGAALDVHVSDDADGVFGGLTPQERRQMREEERPGTSWFRHLSAIHHAEKTITAGVAA